jgi:hypothetical protein
MAVGRLKKDRVTESGNTAGRPSNPVIGDTYYNGEVEALEIYNGTNWKVLKSEGFPPDAPTISSVTDSSSSLAYSSTAGTLDVVFVPAGTGGTATQYNAYTTTGGHSGFTTVGNTVTITGLTPGTAYTVYGNAQNGSGTSTNTANASPVTPTTLPQAPTIGTATASGSVNEVAVTWTLGSNGGKTLSAITITPYLNGTTAGTSRTAATTSSTSYTFTDGQLTGGSSYTFKVKTTNANGDSPESSATNSATMPSLAIINYLVVAGGGSGTFGGGGAGGLRSSVTATGGGGTLESALILNQSTNYTVTVGAGGAASTYPAEGNNGANSVFSTITSTGGAGGGAGNTGNGKSGGSGSGGGHKSGGLKSGGAGTANQGYAGGGGGGEYFGGGGGGAGAVGYAGYPLDNNANGNQTGTDGDGGVGVAVSITGTSVTYAGGGGGAYGGGGGAGGGGDAATSSVGNASNGTANLGGGGGASNATLGAGGSGVVILRYPSTLTITVGAGLTADATGTDGSFSYKRFTAGSGNVSWA